MAFDNTDPVNDVKARYSEFVSGTPEAAEAALNVAIKRDLPNDQFVAAMQNLLADIQPGLRGAEASLVQGGYDPGVATAVAASAGVGVSQENIEEVAAAYAMRAAAAIRNGIPLDQLTVDPQLSAQAQQEIYENIAAQQGTSAAQIAENAKKQAEADMQAVQALVGAGVAKAKPVGLAEAMGFAPEAKEEKNPFAQAIESSEHGVGLLAALSKAFGRQPQSHETGEGLPASQSITGLADLGQSGGRGQG